MSSLIQQIKAVLHERSPHPEPEIVPNPYGYGKQAKCPKCGGHSLVHGFGSHWVKAHGDPDWREKKIIELVKRSLKGKS